MRLKKGNKRQQIISLDSEVINKAKDICIEKKFMISKVVQGLLELWIEKDGEEIWK